MPVEPDRCEAVGRRLVALADGEEGFTAADRRHLRSCIRCQAEQVHYQRLQRVMAMLRDAPPVVGPALDLAILDHIDEHGDRLWWPVSARVTAAVSGLVAGAAASLIVLTARRRTVRWAS